MIQVRHDERIWVRVAVKRDGRRVARELAADIRLAQENLDEAGASAQAVIPGANRDDVGQSVSIEVNRGRDPSDRHRRRRDRERGRVESARAVIDPGLHFACLGKDQVGKPIVIQIIRHERHGRRRAGGRRHIHLRAVRTAERNVNRASRRVRRGHIGKSVVIEIRDRWTDRGGERSGGPALDRLTGKGRRIGLDTSDAQTNQGEQMDDESSRTRGRLCGRTQGGKVVGIWVHRAKQPNPRGNPERARPMSCIAEDTQSLFLRVFANSIGH